MKSRSSDLPTWTDISPEEFDIYKDDWMLWRALGTYNGSGAWVAPVSFLEAQDLPKRQLDVFFALDDFLDRMYQQKAKQKAKQDA